jgi:hypothetical protein
MAESFEDKLINFLVKINAMNQKAGRERLLLNLPPGPISSIARYESTLDDLTSIVKTTNGWGKLRSGEFALKIVMNNTVKIVEGLASESELRQLIYDFDYEFKTKQDEKLEIPFVIIAMTQAEAIQLREMTFNQPGSLENEFKNFQELIQMIEEHGVVDFISHYAKIREEWKPYICQEHTIKDVVNDIIEEINYHHSEVSNLPLIKPKFLSHDCLGLDDNKRVTTWDELRQLGCVLIVDSISLFHPTVREKLLKAEISSNKNAAILVLSPINHSAIQANQLLEQTIKNQMEPAFLRFHEELDKLCEIGIGDLRAIKRWFFSVIPETTEIIIKQKPQLKNKQRLRERMGQRNGVDKLWTGSSI